MPDDTDGARHRAFQKHLARNGIAYEVLDDGTLRIPGNLTLDRSDHVELPDALVVDGDFTITGSPITRLPRRLHVDENLYIHDTKITDLPQELFIGENLVLSSVPMKTLPDNLHVHGSLSLVYTRVHALPKGLVIGDSLDISQTPIVRLPDDLRVGGLISPPNGMPDLRAFMDAHHADDTMLPVSWPASHHQRMQLRAQMQPYPNLMRVMESLGDTFFLRLVRRANGSVEGTVHALHHDLVP